MLLGCIADDFTGAGDLANTLTKGGMRTRLFIGSPGDRLGHGCDAGVVALKSRSVPAPEAVTQSLEALAWLQRCGCRQFLFKYCSTFDSTPGGNIGPVAEALSDRLEARGVVVCPAFPATGRTLYQGHLFVQDRLLSESGMAHHPLTPMADPDIRRWLERQSSARPGHVALDVVRAGPVALAGALAAAHERLVVVDATSDEDLRVIGRAATNAPLVTGGSGIALGLPDNFRAAGLLDDVASVFHGRDGPALVLAGSCSAATADQVSRYRAGRPAMAVDVGAFLGGVSVEAEIEAFLEQHVGDAPLVYSTASADAIDAIQARHPGCEAARRIEQLFGRIARRAVARGIGRIVVAGGETSGAVVTALGVTSLDVGPEIDPGIPALFAGPCEATPTGIALALKSGNFGGTDILARAVEHLGRDHG